MDGSKDFLIDPPSESNPDPTPPNDLVSTRVRTRSIALHDCIESIVVVIVVVVLMD
jgi:hypothetical protein